MTKTPKVVNQYGQHIEILYIVTWLKHPMAQDAFYIFLIIDSIVLCNREKTQLTEISLTAPDSTDCVDHDLL